MSDQDQDKVNFKALAAITIGVLVFFAAAFLVGVYKTSVYKSLPGQLKYRAVVKDKLYSPERNDAPVISVVSSGDISYGVVVGEEEHFKLLLVDSQTGKAGTIAVNQQMFAEAEQGSTIELTYLPDYEQQKMKLASIRPVKSTNANSLPNSLIPAATSN